jgi:carbon-monoxide dehydrogenase medium subunit
MIPPPFDYVVPKSLPEAIKLLAKPEAKVLAGGQSLIPMMKFRLAEPALLIDINRLEGMAYVREEGDWLKIGALTREGDLEQSDLVRLRYPLLADAARVIADPVVRSMATVGGNLAHGDPANDHPAVMLAYGAQIVAMGQGGERVIPIAKFFQGPFDTALTRDEILTEIRIPLARKGDGGAYLKVERKVGDYAVAAVAAWLRLDASGKCERVGIGLTNVAATPIQASSAEGEITGKALDDATIKKASQLAAEAAEPAEDLRGSEDYKRALVKTLTARALRRAMERAKGGPA